MPTRWRPPVLFLAFLVTGVLLGSRGGAQSEAIRLKECMSAAEFEKYGLQKLTPQELGTLEAWLGRQMLAPPIAAAPQTIRSGGSPAG